MSLEQKGVQLLDITENNDQQRVDNYLMTRLKGVPRSHIYRLIRKGEIRINKKRCKPDTRLHTGDQLRVAPIRLSTRESPAAPGAGLVEILKQSILFENDDFLAVNKPQGLAVHAGTGLHLGLIEAMRQIFPQHEFLELAHRLDKDTSGCLLIAKNQRTLKLLHKGLKEKTINKTYYALVHGRWPLHKQQVSVSLQKNEIRAGERIVTVDEEGKTALTRFRVMRTFRRATLIEAMPVTGRTHQIRVHCQHAGHPILGDSKYTPVANRGGLKVKNLCLHAAQVEFSLPVGAASEAQEQRRFCIKAPMNETMAALIKQLGSEQSA